LLSPYSAYTRGLSQSDVAVLLHVFHGERPLDETLQGIAIVDCSIQHIRAHFSPKEAILEDRCSTIMARYFFHIDGTRAYRDEHGEELPHGAAACHAAVRLTRDIEDGFRPGHTWRLKVHDGNVPVYVVEIVPYERR